MTRATPQPRDRAARSGLAMLVAVTTASAMATTVLFSAAPATAAPTAPPAAGAAAVTQLGPIGGPALASIAPVAGRGVGAAGVPKVSAATWVLAEAETGRVLAARGAHVQRPPASTLKTLTALTLIPRLGPADTYRVVDADVRVSGSKVGLMVGKDYTHEQLFTALFLPSGNDAAAALARSNGGLSQTQAQMNEVARSLQANDTVVKNPSGLDADGQLSSAYDLALVARAGLQDDEFRRYASTTRAKFPGKSLGGGKRAMYEIQNQNPLLGSYSGAIGIKTGFTTKAGRTFVGAAERNGRTLIVVMMGIGQPTKLAASQLLDWGFANADLITAPVGQLVDPIGGDGAPEAAAEVEAAGLATEGAEGGTRWFAYSLAGIAVIAGAGLIAMAVLNSEPLTRRRIRRRYR
jgi:D-alanyl-D-alanine carboxypeptidase (penicillin-binding protein 5/6)